MSRCQWFVYSLLFCFASYLNVNLNCTPTLVAQEYVPQEYAPQEYVPQEPAPQNYIPQEYRPAYEYPSQQYYLQQSQPLQPQYQPPLYSNRLPQNDYRNVPGVLLSEKVIPQVNQEAFDKATKEMKLLEEELGNLENNYNTLLADKQKLSSELDARQTELQRALRRPKNDKTKWLW